MPRKKQQSLSAGELGFDMTPMIDVVFQLIIFFLVALSFVESQSEAKLTLPVADQARPPGPEEVEYFVFNVLNKNASWVTSETHIYRAMRRNMDLNGLREELDKAAKATERKGKVEAAVIIRGDRFAPWSDIRVAMGACKEAGFTKVFLKALEAKPQ